jgi:hypothetical protein
MRSASMYPILTNQRDTRQNTRFGCRMIATMNALPKDKEAAISSAAHSLRAQSTRPHREGYIHNDDYFLPVSQVINHVDGYGGLLLEQDHHHTSVNSIAECHHFKTLLSRFKNRSSGLFHARYATVGEVTKANVHPYHYQGIGLVQNGSLDSPKMDGFLYSDTVLKTVKRYLPDIQLNKNDSDSRRMFYFWLAQLKKTYPNTPLNSLPTDAILSSFKSAQNQVMQTRPQSHITLAPSGKLPVNGILNFTNKINSIISVAPDRIIGLKHGRELRLGYRLNEKGGMESALLATEPPEVKGYKWVNLPDNHWIILTKLSPTEVKAELRPYELT